MNYDNTRFDIDSDEAAVEAIDNHYAGSAPSDDDVVTAIADSVFDGYVESDDEEADEKEMLAYFDAADSWIPTISEFTDAEDKAFRNRGIELFREKFVD